MTYEIIPGILEKEWSEIEKKLHIISSFSKSAHIDIIDGEFAPNLTFLDPKPFQPYQDKVFLEVHMMVENPIQYVETFANAGFKRFIGHIEMISDQESFIQKVKARNAEAVFAVDGPTSLTSINVPYEDLDGILCMTIKAGFSGQAFMPEHLTKVKDIRNKATALPIEVDGGTNEKTILLSKEAGATRFVATSAITDTDNPKEAFEKLTKLINNT